MKKLILSSLAVLGLSAAFVAPAKAQVLVNSTPSGASITGAASVTNINGATSAIAGEVTYPEGIFADDVTVTLTPPTDTFASGEATLEVLVVSGTMDKATLLPTNTSNVEAAVAAAINSGAVTAADVSEQVSLIRAWTAGGLDFVTNC
jgi:hypothetical protein